MASIARAPIARARRAVVKVGSRTIAHDDSVYGRLADQVANARARGVHVVLVSSGAIALGVSALGYRTRPKEMGKLQAAAAAGQSLLMRAYEEAFSARGMKIGQVLLTHADLSDRARANNARAAIAALLDAKAVPILNENDSVAVEEIKFGDNDALSSMVVPLVEADLLVLLSDVPGLLDGEGNRVPVVHDVEREAMPLVQTKKSAEGTGGMASKLGAARAATFAGAHVVLADARQEGVIDDVFAGKDVGTWFVAANVRIPAKKHWIAFTLRPRGDVILDRGAANAVSNGKKSVLSVGVLGVRGDFRVGDAVRLVGPDGVELGRGLSRYSAADAVRFAGKSREALAVAAKEEADVFVHRDELVVWESRA